MNGDQDPTKKRGERPDTLVGYSRANALRTLSDLGMDTTNFSQRGLERLFSGPFMDSLNSVRKMMVEKQDDKNKPTGPLTYRTTSALPYHVGGLVNPSIDPSEIVLNLVAPFVQQTDAPLAFTETQWNEKPEDRARRVLLHEAFHTRSSLPAEQRLPLLEEGNAEMFQTAFDVLSKARPEYTRQDYVDLFEDEYNKYNTAYRGGYTEGDGSREDPLRSNKTSFDDDFSRGRVINFLNSVSQADVFKDNPYKDTRDPTFLEKVSNYLRGLRGG